jgi:hypothetical protein
MFRYRLHSPDGDDLGEATYAMMIRPGEEIHLDAGQRFHVIDVVPFEEESRRSWGCYRWKPPKPRSHARAVVAITHECESLCVRLSAHQRPRTSRVEIRRIASLLIVAGLVFAICGCGGGNEPKREVLRSASPLSADLYVRVSGPAGVVDYIADRLSTGGFATYGRGVFLPPRVRRHRRQKVCSITHTVDGADSPSVQAWRGKKARVDVYGDDTSSEAIFCKIIPLILAHGS